MSYIKIILVSLFLLSGSFITAQTTFEVTFPNPNSHYINVEAKFTDVGRDSVDIKMPVWTPGSYMVREYSKNVESFKVTGVDGAPLKVTKVRKNVWRVYHGINKTINCRYLVYANELNVRSCFVDGEHAYINGAGLFMYADLLRDKPHLVLYRPPAAWKKISNGLEKYGSDIWSCKAENYDELIDAPVVMGNHEVFSFDYKGIPHHIAMVGEAKYDSVKIKNDFYKIVDLCTEIFGENPNKNYTFIIHNTLSGGGGLEHRNSCSIMTARTNYENDKGYRGLLSLVAHEYFHLWIVKRVRPLELGPFDYENEVYTNQLWFFEGFTSFYDDYLVYKAGFMTREEYLDLVKTNMQTVLNTPGDKVQPVSEASYDAWIKYYRRNENSKNSTVSYYTKGGALATIFYLDMLNSSNGSYGLDSMMSFLYNEHYKNLNRGMSDAELQEYFEVFGNKDYDDFFAKYIHGTEEIPFEQYFNYAGLKFKRTDGMKNSAGYMGATLTLSGNKMMVTEIERGSPAETNGLSANDEITAIDNQAPDKIVTYLSQKQVGSAVKIKLLRAGLPREITVTLGEQVTKEFVWEFDPKPTELQKKVLEGWLGK